jgi:hypothetical protein
MDRMPTDQHLKSPRFSRLLWWLSLSMLTAIVLLPFLGQSQDQPPGEEPAETPSVPKFKFLWQKQATFSFGLLGYREVSETDLFNVRWFNPGGSDFITTQKFSPVTRQYMLPMLSIDARYQRIYPLFWDVLIPIHAEVSGELFLQHQIAPSMAMNVLYEGESYAVSCRNLPSLMYGEVMAGIWFSEMVSIGAGFYLNHYQVNTSDDRTIQQNYSLNCLGAVPYASLRVPLDFIQMQRWTAAAGVYSYHLFSKDADYRAMKTELAIYRLSQKHSGRVFGLFFRSLNHFSLPAPEADPADYLLHYDHQYLIGFSFGTGGMNQNRGL